LENEEVKRDVSFFQINYRKPTIDLRNLERLINIDLPDSIAINPPDLSEFDHVVVLIGVTENMDHSDMVVWLAGNYNYRNITFFIDYDQDRDFTNDKPSVKIKAGAKNKEVILKTTSGERKLWLSIPEVEVKRIEKYRVRIANRVAVGFSGGAGSGEISYRYDDLTIGYPTEYYVKITEKNITASLSYDIKNFNFGVSASFQNHYYFTSHLDVTRGEPFVRIVQGFIPIYDDNIDHHVNLDKHSNNRVQLGAFGTYKVKIGRAIDLQAKFLFGQTHYFIPEYNRFVNKEGQVYALGSSPFYEIGIRSEFAIGISKAVFVELARNEQRWRPEGLLDDTPHANFESNAVFLKLNVGYRFVL
jgi:hypothetical protein